LGSAGYIEKLGKRRLEQGGKYRVNENDEDGNCCKIVSRVTAGGGGPVKMRSCDRSIVIPGRRATMNYDVQLHI